MCRAAVVFVTVYRTVVEENDARSRIRST